MSILRGVERRACCFSLVCNSRPHGLFSVRPHTSTRAHGQKIAQTRTHTVKICSDKRSARAKENAQRRKRQITTTTTAMEKQKQQKKNEQITSEKRKHTAKTRSTIHTHNPFRQRTIGDGRRNEQNTRLRDGASKGKKKTEILCELVNMVCEWHVSMRSAYPGHVVCVSGK